MRNSRTATVAALASHFGLSTAFTPVAVNDNSPRRSGSEVAPSFALVGAVMAELPNGDHYDC